MLPENLDGIYIKAAPHTNQVGGDQTTKWRSTSKFLPDSFIAALLFDPGSSILTRNDGASTNEDSRLKKLAPFS
jgi:hypothetical protein